MLYSLDRFDLSCEACMASAPTAAKPTAINWRAARVKGDEDKIEFFTFAVVIGEHIVIWPLPS